jgi:O-acetyl-ADP-ribose deacetylase (regulator of RNase III)
MMKERPTYIPPNDPAIYIPDPGRPLAKVIWGEGSSSPTQCFILFIPPGVRPRGPKISITLGSIVTRQEWMGGSENITAVVNAANSKMRGGNGVDGAIHSAAGPGLLQHSIENDLSCPEGGAVVTPAFKMTEVGYTYIIHTVGPIGKQPEILRKCYRSVLDAARKFKVINVALPLISGGVFSDGWPIEENTKTAIDAIVDWMIEFRHSTHIEHIQFVLLPTERDKADALWKALEGLTTTRPAASE